MSIDLWLSEHDEEFLRALKVDPQMEMNDEQVQSLIGMMQEIDRQEWIEDQRKRRESRRMAFYDGVMCGVVVCAVSMFVCGYLLWEWT